MTFNRPQHLAILLDSIEAMEVRPGVVVLVDNASDAATADVVKSWQDRSSIAQINYVRLDSNTGGAGGFSIGLSKGLSVDADWFWLLDDDVEILPDGLSRLLKWTDRFKCLHGQRYDAAGLRFFDRQRINEALGIQVPITTGDRDAEPFFLTNYAIFEGMLISRDIVVKIGLPDPRFFIVWDDAIYGWIASRITEVAFINEFVLKRTRHHRTISLGFRHLNDASDLSRYHMMRNRALIQRYFQHYGVFRSMMFRLGTALVFFKEVGRLVVVERRFYGIGSLFAGMKAAAQIRSQQNWQPMPPFDNHDLERMET